jgi:hypothetical protein
VCVGSEMEGGVHDVDVRGVRCHECGDGLRFKTKQTVSGNLATNLSFQDVVMDKIGGPVNPATGVPLYGYFGIGIATAGCRDVHFRHVVGTDVQDAGNLDVCHNVSMRDVHIECGAVPRPPGPWYCAQNRTGAWHCGKNFSGTAATVSPFPSPPCFSSHDQRVSRM